MLLALTNHLIFLILIFFGVLMSIALGGSSVTTTSALLSKRFHRQQATVMSLNAAGASLGGLLLVPFTVYLIGLVGWRTTWVVLGLMTLILVLPLAFFLLKDDPEEMGLLPDGAPQPLDEGQAGPTRPGPLEVASWRDSFRSKPMWQLCGGYFVCGCSIALVSTHFVPFTIERGYAPATAATAYGLMRRSACLPISTTRPCSYVNGKRDLIEVRVALAACTSPWVEYPPRRRDVSCLP